jgi:hypothetical protein
VGVEAPDGSASCQYNFPAFPCFFHKLILLLLPPRDPPLQNLRSQRDHEGGDGVKGPTVDGVFWYTKHVHYTLVWI